MSLKFICLLLAAMLLLPTPSSAQSVYEGCNDYLAVIAGNDSLPRAFPPDLVQPNERAVKCFASVIATYDNRIQSVESLEQPELRADLVSATAGLREVMQLYEKQGQMRAFIELAAREFDLPTTSVLSFAGRGADKDLRINSVLILGNAIGDRTACVPIIHLGDPKFMARMDPETAAKARANLLALTSVVAPWSVRENAEAIGRVQAFFSASVTQAVDPVGTPTIVANLEKRLAARDLGSRSPMAADAKAQCDGYAKAFYSRFETPPDLQFWK